MKNTAVIANLARRTAAITCVLALGACGAPSGPVTVTQGDTTLNTRDDGSFDLVVGGRTLLQGRPAPLEVRHTNVGADMLWGLFSFDEGEVHSARPTARSDARVDGTDLVLTLSGGGAGGTLRFARKADEVSISAAGEFTDPAIGGSNAMKIHLACRAGDRFLGFGEQYQSIDHRGEAFTLSTSEQGIGRDPAHPGPLAGNPFTTYYPVPFFVDPRQGFGVAVDTDARVQVDLCSTDAAEYVLAADEGKSLLVHLYTGPTVADVVRAFTVRQGRSRAAPRWAVEGVWLGVQGGPARVRDVVAKAKAANVRLGAVWAQDWIGATDLGGGLTDLKYHWTIDETQYPNLAALTAELHAQQVRFLGYFNPFVMAAFDQWGDAVTKAYLPLDANGQPWRKLITTTEGSMVDLTNPDAVAWFQGFARRALDLGLDGWMGDFGEWLPFDVKLRAGEPRLEHNRYPSRWHSTWKDLIGEDKVVFTRSGWLGEAAVAQVVWAGDQTTDWSPWDGLPTVVPALISLGLAGIGYVTHDVAGYFGGFNVPASTKELYLRWMELGALTPIFRTHEGLASQNNWQWFSDPDTTAAMSRWSRVHALLADTFIALSDEHDKTGMPIVRALALQFPSDDRAVTTSDEFLIGTDLLVAPVTVQGAVSRSVYFPTGHWIDAWDPTHTVDGPRDVTVAAPIGRPPVFSLSGRTDLAAVK